MDLNKKRKYYFNVLFITITITFLLLLLYYFIRDNNILIIASFFSGFSVIFFIIGRFYLGFSLFLSDERIDRPRKTDEEIIEDYKTWEKKKDKDNNK
jgi:hypothetical protein